MLYGDFSEGSASVPVVPIEDEGISEEGVVRFLSFLHPCHMMFLWSLLPSNTLRTPQHNNLSDHLYKLLFNRNVDLLVEVFRLAHKFQIHQLVDFCIHVIEMNSELSLAERLLLSDAYHLPRLMARCLGKMTTARGVKRMLQENHSLLDDLSCQAHKLLTERLIELV